MRFFKPLIFLCFSLVLSTCGENKAQKKSPFKIDTGTNSFSLGDTLKLSIKNPKNITLQNIDYLLDDKPIDSNEILDNIRLGKKSIKAIISYEDEIDTISASIKVFNNIKPSIYTYEIVNTFPHDISSYTQGLEFHNGVLYESTGQRGESKLRKINFETGEILADINLSRKYFGEGLTILKNKIYQLTWQSKTGFIYDVETFEKVSSFKYGQSTEGWGICNDGNVLYKSDGTEKIWLLNPENLTEIGHIEVYTEKGKIPSLNELEWIEGKIYANIYQRNGVAIIDPLTGGVEGVIDFKPLRKLVEQHDRLDVLNGIAYNKERKTIFVTGKNWNKLFEVKIKKR